MRSIVQRNPGEGALLQRETVTPHPSPLPTGEGAHLRRGKSQVQSNPQEKRQRLALPLILKRYPRSLHLAFVVETVLVILDDGGDRFQRQLTIGIFHHVLQIEVLDRDVII